MLAQARSLVEIYQSSLKIFLFPLGQDLLSLKAAQDISSEKSRTSLELTDRIVHKSAVRVLMHRNKVINYCQELQ